MGLLVIDHANGWPKRVPVWLRINAGINDGHNGSVPINHSLEAFNVLAVEKDRIGAKEISEPVKTAKVPASSDPH